MAKNKPTATLGEIADELTEIVEELEEAIDEITDVLAERYVKTLKDALKGLRELSDDTHAVRAKISEIIGNDC